MAFILAATLLVLGALVIATLGGGLLVLLAYGLGWLLTRLLPFSMFEATLLGLFGMTIAGVAAWRLLTTLVTLPAPLSLEEDEDEEDYDDEEGEEEIDDEGDAGSSALKLNDTPGIPRWRQPLKKVDFSNAKPDDRCPCGSGRKYKNCHGRKARA